MRRWRIGMCVWVGCAGGGSSALVVWGGGAWRVEAHAGGQRPPPIQTEAAAPKPHDQAPPPAARTCPCKQGAAHTRRGVRLWAGDGEVGAQAWASCRARQGQGAHHGCCWLLQHAPPQTARVMSDDDDDEMGEPLYCSLWEEAGTKRASRAWCGGCLREQESKVPLGS